MTNGDWNSIKNFVDVMHLNLTNAGLIKTSIPAGTTYTDTFSTKNIIDYDTNTFVATMTGTTPTLTGTYSTTQYLFSTQYDLPTGDGSITTDVHPLDTKYKKIISESYDPTPVRIRFDFAWINIYSSSNISIGNRILRVITQILNPITNIIYYSFYTSYNISGNSSHNISLLFSGSSYISMTGKTLSLLIGKNVLNGSSYPSTNNEYNTYLINLNIYRNNGKIFIYGIRGNNVNTTSPFGYLNNISSSVIQYSIDQSNGSSATLDNNGNNFLMWAHGTNIPSLSGGEIITGKVYGINAPNIIMQIPQFVITRKMDASESIIPLVYKYNNELILGNFLNLGLSERSICPVVPQSKTYSWASLYETDVSYTTSHVGT